MGLLRIVAARELTERARSKAFLISNVIILAAIGGAAMLPQLLGDPGLHRVGITGHASAELATVVEAQAAGGGGTVEVVELDHAAAAESAVVDGEVDFAIVDGTTVLTDNGLPGSLEPVLQLGSQSLALEQALADAGVPPGERSRLLGGGTLTVEQISTPDTDREAAQDALATAGPVAYLAVVALYGLLIFYGQWVAQGIVEEKQSRVVEVVLSTVSTRQLLAGKVLGIGVLGLGQILLIAAAGTVALLFATEIEPPPGMAPIVAVVLAWYLLGYAIYALLFAVTGAIVARVEDLQSAATPIIIVIVAGFAAAQFALQNPTGTVAVVLGYVPLTAPLIQPIRVAAETATGVEIIIAAALGLATVAGLVPLVARLYAGGVLRTRARVRLRDAWG